jgi:plasmid maintenance system antidote protein VapI
LTNIKYGHRIRRMVLLGRIKEQIETCGKSRYQISQETGVDQATLSRIVQGGSCKVETADLLLEYFGMDLVRKGWMHMRRHKYRSGEPTATFEELNFQEQTKSITATVNKLGAMIDANLRRARQEDRDENRLREQRLAQVERMVDRRRSR